MSTTTEFETTVPTLPAELSDSERHRLLADERRRIVLDVLAERKESLTLTELVTEVECRENGGGSSESTVSENIMISLHHVHLPMIADSDIVEYDYETNRIDPR